MSTKFYYRSTFTGSLDYTPVPSGWSANYKITLSPFDLSKTKGAAAVTHQLLVPYTGQAVWGFWGMFISPPLNGDQTVGGGPITFNTGNYSEYPEYLRFSTNKAKIYVWRPSTGTVVGTVWNRADAWVGPSYPAGVDPITDVTQGTVDASYAIDALDGDVVVVEQWSSSTGQYYNWYAGHMFNGTTENTTENATVTNHASYIIFNETLIFKLVVTAAITNTLVLGTGNVGSVGINKSGSVALTGVEATGGVSRLTGVLPTYLRVYDIAPLPLVMKFSPKIPKWITRFWGPLPSFNFTVPEANADSGNAQGSDGTMAQRHVARVTYIEMQVPEGDERFIVFGNTGNASQTTEGRVSNLGDRGTGNSAVGYVRGVGHGTDVALLGVQGVGGIQSVGEGLAVVLTGVLGTGRFGSILVHGSTVALTGVQGAGAVTTVGTGLLITGVAAAGTVGTVAAIAGTPRTVALTGLQISAIVGSVTKGLLDHLAGVGAVTGVGNLASNTSRKLTTATGYSSVGSMGISPHKTVHLTGNEGLVRQGPLLPRPQLHSVLTGCDPGTLFPAHQNALHGVAGAGQVSTPLPMLQFALEGLEASGGAGNLDSLIDYYRLSEGVEAQAEVGECLPATVVRLFGVGAAALQGSMVGSTAHKWTSLTGVQSGGALGSMRQYQIGRTRYVVVPPDILYRAQELTKRVA